MGIKLTNRPPHGSHNDSAGVSNFGLAVFATRGLVANEIAWSVEPLPSDLPADIDEEDVWEVAS